MEWSEWQGLIGALGGVLLTGLIGLVTAKLSHGWQREQHVEDRRQARADRRRDAYVAYLAQAQKVGDQTSLWIDVNSENLSDSKGRTITYMREMAERTHEYDACLRRVLLAAGERVQAATRTYDAWFREATRATVSELANGFKGWDEHEAPLIEAMHRELEEDAGIPER